MHRATGRLTVSGKGSQLVVADRNLYVGLSGGAGSVSVTEGASLSLGTGECFVGIGSSPIGPGIGDLTLTGASLTARTFSVGTSDAYGDVDLLDASVLQVTQDMRVDRGTCEVSGASSVTTGNAVVADGNGTHASLVVSGPGTLFRGLSGIGTNGNVSEGTTGPIRWDLSAFWHITEHFSLTLEGINLTDEKERLFTTGDGTMNLIREINYSGRQAFAGIRWSL
jgi:T5SS/PEP-CTERM-associated repeat protein